MRPLILALCVALLPALAEAQAPTLAAPTLAPTPGSSVTLTVTGAPGAAFADLVYLVNVGTAPREVSVEELRGRPLVLHPVLAARTAADRRVREARFDPSTGRFTVPARTAVVFVANDPRSR